MGNRQASREEGACYSIIALSLPLELWSDEIFPRLHWSAAVPFRRTCRQFAAIYARWFTPEALCTASTRDYNVGYRRAEDDEGERIHYCCLSTPSAGPLLLYVLSSDSRIEHPLGEMYLGYAVEGRLLLPLILTRPSNRHYRALITSTSTIWWYGDYFSNGHHFEPEVPTTGHANHIELFLTNPLDVHEPVCSIRIRTPSAFTVRFRHHEQVHLRILPDDNARERRGSPLAHLVGRTLRTLADALSRGQIDLGLHWSDYDSVLYYTSIFHPGRFDCACLPNNVMRQHFAVSSLDHWQQQLEDEEDERETSSEEEEEDQ